MAVSSIQEVFEVRLPERLAANPELAEQMNSRYKFDITGDGGGIWVIDLVSSPPAISIGDGEADLTLTMEAADFLELVRGNLNGQMAFMLGKMKLEGDMALIFKLQGLLRPSGD